MITLVVNVCDKKYFWQVIFRDIIKSADNLSKNLFKSLSKKEDDLQHINNIFGYGSIIIAIVLLLSIFIVCNNMGRISNV